jgi:hypothetical protein
MQVDCPEIVLHTVSPCSPIGHPATFNLDLFLMRTILRLLFLPVALLSSFVGGARGQSPIPTVAIALTAHFQTNGLAVEPRVVRVLSGEPKSAFELRFKDLSLPVFVSEYSTPLMADKAMAKIGDRPSHAYPRKNENIIMVLPFWDDSIERLPKVLEAFALFKQGH